MASVGSTDSGLVLTVVQKYRSLESLKLPLRKGVSSRVSPGEESAQAQLVLRSPGLLIDPVACMGAKR